MPVSITLSLFADKTSEIQRGLSLVGTSVWLSAVSLRLLFLWGSALRPFLYSQPISNSGSKHQKACYRLTSQELGSCDSSQTRAKCHVVNSNWDWLIITSLLCPNQANIFQPWNLRWTHIWTLSCVGQIEETAPGPETAHPCLTLITHECWN